MSKPRRHDPKSRSSRVRACACWASLAMLSALAACSRTSEPTPTPEPPAPSAQALTPKAPESPAPAASAPRPSPRYTVAGARVLDTERTPQTDQVLNAVRRHVHGLMPCYVRALEELPTLAGSIKLELTVSPAGALTDITLEPTKPELELVSACAHDMLSSAQVALPPGVLAAPLRAHYDLSFSPPPPNPKPSSPTVIQGEAPAAPK